MKTEVLHCESIKSLQNFEYKMAHPKAGGLQLSNTPSYRRRAYDEGPLQKQLSRRFALTAVCSVVPFTSLINYTRRYNICLLPVSSCNFLAQMHCVALIYKLSFARFLSLNLTNMKDLLSATGKCLRGTFSGLMKIT